MNEINKVSSFGKFQGILKNKDKEIYMPNIHYLLFEDDKVMTGVCLELGTTYSHDKMSNDEVIRNLISVSISFLNNIINKNDDHQCLIEIFQDNSMEKHWSTYRKLSLQHSLTGKKHIENTFNEIIEDFVEQIQKLRKENEDLKLENSILRTKIENQPQLEPESQTYYYIPTNIEKNIVSIS